MRTIVIVDDNAGFRAQARAMLEAEGFSVIGEAEDGRAAVAVCRDLKPEVVLVDVALPDTDGFELTARLRRDLSSEAPPMVVLTSSREAGAYRLRIRDSRAKGFIPKDELSGAAINAITPTP
jgi:DNA-binding NarL/FixJ family response regulator